jgi:hypothetical protein
MREDIIQYVADMTRQLAELCRQHYPGVARILDFAAEFAREAARVGRG